VLYGLLRLCINVFIVYIVYLLTKDIARILFGRRHAHHTKPPVVVQQHPEQKEQYQDVQDAKFEEYHSS
jgi:hypothetical protein